MKRYTVQFWIRHRGRQDVTMTFAHPPGRWPHVMQIAFWIVNKAMYQYNNRWPGATKDELYVIGIRDEETGQEVLTARQPWFEAYKRAKKDGPVAEMISGSLP